MCFGSQEYDLTNILDGKTILFSRVVWVYIILKIEGWGDEDTGDKSKSKGSGGEKNHWSN